MTVDFLASDPSDLARWRPNQRAVFSKLRESLAMLGLLLSRNRGESNRIYEILAAHNNLGTRTLYLNMGYWQDAASYDDACEALALLLADRAELAPEEQVMDCGFGFADQDVLWARRYGVRIVGFNINQRQVVTARARVRAAGMADRIDLRCRSMLDTGLPSASVDCVLALESAFHLPSRDALFREARRVLRPGGRIVIADICAKTPRSRRLYDRISAFCARKFWQIPADNDYGSAEYARRMTAAGFCDVRADDISAAVFNPFTAYARRRQREADVVARANPLVRAGWRAPMSADVFDYVLISARRAEESP